MPNSSDSINPDVIQPQKLEDSFDYVLNRLQEIRQRTAESDRQVYRAVGDFATAAQRTANAAEELLVEIQDSPPAESFVQRLSDRWQSARQEADELLCTANTDAAIDRVLKLEQLIERIERRLVQLVPPPSTQPSSDKDTVPPLEQMTVSELKDLAKIEGLTGYSKLNKKKLIERIKHHLLNRQQ
jgi:hypothetical protein